MSFTLNIALASIDQHQLPVQLCSGPALLPHALLGRCSQVSFLSKSATHTCLLKIQHHSGATKRVKLGVSAVGMNRSGLPLVRPEHPSGEDSLGHIIMNIQCKSWEGRSFCFLGATGNRAALLSFLIIRLAHTDYYVAQRLCWQT